jgi:hypothetical protein
MSNTENIEQEAGALSHLSVELGTINDEWKLGMGVEYKGEKHIVTDIDEGWDFRCPKKTLLGSANERMQECLTPKLTGNDP